jgi:plastocyanin
MLTCQRNFGSWMSRTNKNEYTAKLSPNETASACFKNPAEIRYVVRAESLSPSGEQNMAGALSVTAGAQVAGDTSVGPMPTMTRTGHVKEVVITEDVSPQALTVNAGDEIRWINERQGNVRVVFLDPVTEMLSCQRNFGGSINEYAAELGPNETASACFKKPGEIKYVVRAQSLASAGLQNMAGALSITGSEQAKAEQEGQTMQAEEPSPVH